MEPFGTHRPTGPLALALWLTRNTPLGRGKLRRPLRNAFQRNPRPLDLVTWGMPMRLHAGSVTGETKVALAPSRYEATELAFLRAALHKPGATFIDIGANAGLYSLNLLATVPHSITVHAFEPQPEMLARLHVSLALAVDHLAKTGSTAHVHPFGLGPQAATMEMVRPDGDFGEASVFAPFADVKGDRISIDVRAVSDIWAELDLDNAAALKIDVEGFEAEILGALIDTLPDALPAAICLEHLAQDHWGRDIISELTALGYRKVATTRANTMMQRS